MSKSVVLETALSLPACDIEALIQGRMIAVIPRTFINPGRQFALYPTNLSINLQPHQRYYRSSFLTITQTTLAKIPCDNVVIKAWARCEGCKMYSPELFDTLSQLTVWTKEALQLSLGQRPHIFLAYLRVYMLSDYLDILSQSQNSQFLPLRPSLNVSEDKPILTGRTFAQRKHQLENLQPPLYPELEKLQSAIAQLSQTNSAAQKLDNDIKIFLGWNSRKLETPDSDLVWIDKIAEVGNSSDGHTFEKFVRRGLLKLGFTGSGLNPDATGGAGGMDFYAEQPYPIVGECKATKTEKVTDGTPAQLLKIGMNHLGKFQYENSIKLIVAAGELNFYALRTATENQMNVISPETLQKLVELQAHYKNSINLLELKECLQQSPFGLVEDKVNSYIDKVEKSLNLRSHILQLLKKHLEKTGDLNVGIDALVVAYIYDSPPETLKDKELYEILIELSSPLTGYLGRIKGSDWKSDRFYFLRDLAITLK